MRHMVRDRDRGGEVEVRESKASRSRGPREISVIFHCIPSSSNSRTKGSCQGKVKRAHRITLGVLDI